MLYTAVLQVEEIVPVGAIPPEDVHVPCIFVDRVLQRSGHQKRIEVYKHKWCNILFLRMLYFVTIFDEYNLIIISSVIILQKLTLLKEDPGKKLSDSPRDRIIRRAALEFTDGMFANLGLYYYSTLPLF